VVIRDSSAAPVAAAAKVTIGAARAPSILERRAEYDSQGRAPDMTEVALAHVIAAGAG
jgi:F420-0:gamma-glutamyl ligase